MDVDILVMLGAESEVIRMSRLILLLDTHFKTYVIYAEKNFGINEGNNPFSQMDIRWPDHHLLADYENCDNIADKLRQYLSFHKLNPKTVMACGSSNSATAGAIVANILHVPFVHLESGRRSLDFSPEEHNRKYIDKLGTVLMAPNNIAKNNLEKEGLNGTIYVIGGLLGDVIGYYSERAVCPDIKGLGDEFIFLALSRRENMLRLGRIVGELGKIAFDVVWLADENVIGDLRKFQMNIPVNVYVIPNVSYLKKLGLVKKCKAVVTDIGELQEECAFLGVPCFTLSDSTEYPETIITGSNLLVGASFNLLDYYFKLMEENAFRGSFGALTAIPVQNTNEKVVEVLKGLDCLRSFDIQEIHRAYLKQVCMMAVKS